MIRPLAVAVLLVAALLPSGPAAAKGLQPVPYAPLPTSYAELPLGPPTSVAWWQDGVLHLGATTIRTRYRNIVARNGTTVVGGRWFVPGRTATAYVVRGDSLVRLPITGYTRGPKVSADGHWIAWLDEHETRLSEDFDRVRYRLVLYDATTGRVAAQHRETRRVEHSDGINGVSMFSVANTGQVLFTRGAAGAHVLAPGRHPVQVKGRLGAAP